MARDDNEYCTNYPAARFHPEAQHMHPRPTSAKQRARTEATVAHSQTDIQGKKYGSEIRKSPTGKKKKEEKFINQDVFMP